MPVKKSESLIQMSPGTTSDLFLQKRHFSLVLYTFSQISEVSDPINHYNNDTNVL